MNNLLTTESVGEGHPDKLADQIAEKISQEIINNDEKARTAIEVLIDGRFIHITGEVKTTQPLTNYTVKKLVWQVIKDDVGYTNETWPNLDETKIEINIKEQSPDLQKKSLMGAGDNSTVFGYACQDNYENYYPRVQSIANKILKGLNKLRKNKRFNFLAPDNKIQIAYSQLYSTIFEISLSQQYIHRKMGSVWTSEEENKEEIKTFIRGFLRNVEKEVCKITITWFELGGPVADTGLTGRKLMVDTYGTFAPHGGGSFAGKDLTKGDKLLALYARFLAVSIYKNEACGYRELIESITIQISSVVAQQNLQIVISAETKNNNNAVIDAVKEYFIEKEYPTTFGGVYDFIKKQNFDFYQLSKYGYMEKLYNRIEEKEKENVNERTEITRKTKKRSLKLHKNGSDKRQHTV